MKLSTLVYGRLYIIHFTCGPMIFVIRYVVYDGVQVETFLVCQMLDISQEKYLTQSSDYLIN